MLFVMANVKVSSFFVMLKALGKARVNGDKQDAVPCTHHESLMGRIISLYGVSLERFLEARLPLGEDKEDLAQEVYIRIANKKPDLLDLDYPKAYLFQTAINILRDRARLVTVRRRRDEVNIDDRHIRREMDFEALTPERRLQGKQKLQQFVSGLDKLPEKCRNIFILNRFKDMSYDEIADHYGISNSAVQKHMMRALKHFNHQMGKG